MKNSPLVAQPEKVAAPESDSNRHGEIDTPTLIVVSALARAAADAFHESVGHAGAAVMFGIPVRAVSATTAYVDWTAIESATQDRIINAAATPVNVLTGTLALAASR